MMIRSKRSCNPRWVTNKFLVSNPISALPMRFSKKLFKILEIGKNRDVKRISGRFSGDSSMGAHSEMLVFWLKSQFSCETVKNPLNPDFKENHMALVSDQNGSVNRDRRKSLIIFVSVSCTYFTLQYLRVTVQFLFDSNKDTLVNEGPCWS